MTFGRVERGRSAGGDHPFSALISPQGKEKVKIPGVANGAGETKVTD